MKIKKILLVLLFAFSYQFTFSQNPQWHWAESAGGVNVVIGSGVAADNFGHCYVTGTFSDSSITFENSTLYSNGNNDIFLVKYDGTGSVIWAKAFGGPDNDNATCIAYDNNDEVYIAGCFKSGSIQFGNYTLVNTGDADIFIAKIDSAGNVIWANPYGGNEFETVKCIGVDGKGNCAISGFFRSDTLFIANNKLVIQNNSIHEDIFTAKFDSNGNVIWANSAGGASDETSESVALDSAGNTILTGEFSSAIFSAGSCNLYVSGGTDVFAIMYDTSGNCKWAQSGSGSSYDFGFGIGIDNYGNCLVVGNFLSDSILLGGSTLINSGQYDVFIAKLNAQGNFLWTKQLLGNKYDNVRSIKILNNGHFLITGYFTSNQLDFDNFILSNPSTFSNINLFIAEFDEYGNAIWGKAAGGVGTDYSFNVSADNNGSYFITGCFNSDSLIIGNDLLLNDSASDADMFIAKIGMVTSDSEIYKQNHFIIFPNPFTSEITIKFPNQNLKQTSVCIKDVYGRIVFSDFKFQVSNFKNIDLSFLQNGIYFLEIASDDYRSIHKIVKQ